MKTLLINPPIKNMIGLAFPLSVKQNEGVFAPLGLMYIASYLRKNVDCEVKILDALAEKMNYGEIEEYIRSFHPTLVGITAYTHNLIDVTRVANIIKNVDQGIHVCLGGPHVNIFPRETIDIPSVDSVVLGEGETTFTELVTCLKENSDLKRIRGIIFKQNGQFINTGLRESNDDLDNLPFPIRRDLDYKKYYNIIGTDSIMTTMVSSRGCPYQCLFCCTLKGYYRRRSPKNIVDEIEECSKIGIKEVHFVDDTFNVDPACVIKICNEINSRRLKIKWSFRGRVNGITKSLLTSAANAGCYRVHLGVETSTDEGLRRLKKGITVDQIKLVFKWTREIGINTVAYFLIGCPHEKTKGDVINTIKFSRDIDPDFAIFNILTPFPSTELYEEGLRRGVLKDNCWREFVLNPRLDFDPPLWEEWLKKEELISLLNLAYRKFYIRPRFIFRILRILSGTRDLKVLLRRMKSGIKILLFRHEK